jgi:[ribosomal protein S5]-alanine N-acetyltransferase
MLDEEKLNYFKWQIPDGSRVRLTLLQKDDLKFLHKWKSQVDIWWSCFFTNDLGLLY